MTRIGKVPDLVVHVIADRTAHVHALADRVGRDRDLQVHAALPERVVVVDAVVGQRVDPEGVAGHFRRLLFDRLDRAAHQVDEHRHLEIQFADGVVQLFDGLLGRLAGNDRRRREPVLEAAVHVRHHQVVGPAGRAAGVVVLDVGQREADGRVHDRVVDSHLGKPLVHEFGQHRGRQVERVLRRGRPVRRPYEVVAPVLRAVHFVPFQPVTQTQVREGLLGHFRSAHLLEIVEDHGRQLQHVPVRVDHGVVQAGPKLPGWRSLCFVHAVSGFQAPARISSRI